MYKALPKNIRIQAKEAFLLFTSNPYHPSLHFKSVHSGESTVFVRISKDYRAVGIMKNDEIIWFWIGSHSDYEKLLKQ